MKIELKDLSNLELLKLVLEDYYSGHDERRNKCQVRILPLSLIPPRLNEEVLQEILSRMIQPEVVKLKIK